MSSGHVVTTCWSCRDHLVVVHSPLCRQLWTRGPTPL